ncbi:TPA: (2Fe-2S)-binding protein [Legionella pneumophila]|nr:(2Fe-2S)-binding protein [Legionella pneumophila]
MIKKHQGLLFFVIRKACCLYFKLPNSGTYHDIINIQVDLFFKA